MSRVGLALIAKNEEDRIYALLDSVRGSFDRVVLLDTGSTDGTIDEFARYCREEKATAEAGNRHPFSFQAASYEWKDDFADARNAADALLMYGSPGDMASEPLVDWKVWADCDDVIVGAHNIRELTAQVPQDVVSLFCGYNYAQSEAGHNLCYLWRERITRATYGNWIGRVHEAIPIAGGTQRVDPSIVEWVHMKHRYETSESSNERNLRILKQWNADEPNNPRVVSYLGTELAIRGAHDEAIIYFDKYQALAPGWDEERAQVYRKWCASLMALEYYDLAYEVAFQALRVLPDWADNYLSLAEVCMAKNQWDKGLSWAKRALEIGKPETMLIINPNDYVGLPLKYMAHCLGRLERYDEAIDMATKASQLNFVDDVLTHELFGWRKIAQREHTANTYAMAAEQLIAFDEQVKAKILLEQCVPHFAHEHPRIVALRSFIRERLLWVDQPDTFEEHYETGGSKPEDFISDEQIDPLCEYLPRTNFLLEGLREQIADAA